MTTATVAAPSKLPLWRTIGQAYALWGENLPDLVRVCWLWMLLMAPVFALLTWWQAPHAMEMMQAVRSGRPFVDPNPLLTMLTQMLGKVVTLPALASIAVAWHRLLLKDEHPGAGAYLRLDGIVVGYAVLALWVGLITMAPGYVSMMFQIVTGTSVTAQDPVALGVQFLAGVGTIAAFFVMARLSLALPGKALGRDDVTFGAAWRVSKGNTWRMLWAYFFCILPMMVFGGGLSYWLYQPGHGRATLTLVSLAVSLLSIPLGMISVGMLSLAYRYFFERSWIVSQFD
jgi:hypothetical protein